MAEASTQGVGSSLRRTALRGSFIVIAAYAARELIRLAANLFVSRLLTPEAYGLMAIVNTLIGGLQMFSDIGLNFSVIHSARGAERSFLGTVWTLQIARGAVLCAIATIAAPAVAAFYGDPRLTSLLAIASISTILIDLRSVSLLYRQRKLQQGWNAAVEVGSMAVASLTMVIWASLDASVWALVAGSLLGALAQVAISHAAPTDLRVMPAWDRGAVREISSFGRWVFVSTLMLYLASQSDRLIFGRFESLATLGIYNVATVFVGAPVIIMNQLGTSIAFPALTRSRDSAASFRAAYLRARRPLVAVGGLMVSLLMACGPMLIEALYDPRWHDAGGYLRWLALQTWFRVLTTAPAAALLAQGLSRTDALGNTLKVVTIPIGVGAGFAIAGFDGAVAGFALSEICRWACYAVACKRSGLPGAGPDLVSTFWVLAAASAGGLAGLAARRLGAPLVVALAASAVVAAIGWAPTLWRLYRSEIRGDVNAAVAR